MTPEAAELIAALDAQVERTRAVLAYADQFDGAPVEWGVNDCSMWPAGWIATATGQELEVPQYNSEAEAFELVEAYGGLADLWRRIADENGIEEIRPEAVREGDVVVVKMRLAQAGAVGGIAVQYGGSILFRTDDGTRMLPMLHRNVLAAFRVPA